MQVEPVELKWNFRDVRKNCPYIYEKRLRHYPHTSRKWRALFGGGKKCSHNASITGGGLQKGWAQCGNKGGGWASQVQGSISGLTGPSWSPEYPTGPHFTSFYISLRTKGQRWLVELRAQGRSHLKQSLSRKTTFYSDSSNQYQMVKRKSWRNYF